MRVSVEGQSEPEIVKERGSIDGAVERVAVFVRDKHQPSARGKTRTRMVRRRGGVVGTELRFPTRRLNPLVPVSSSGSPDLRLLCFGPYQQVSPTQATPTALFPTDLCIFLEPWVTTSR